MEKWYGPFAPSGEVPFAVPSISRTICNDWGDGKEFKVFGPVRSAVRFVTDPSNLPWLSWKGKMGRLLFVARMKKPFEIGLGASGSSAFGAHLAGGGHALLKRLQRSDAEFRDETVQRKREHSRRFCCRSWKQIDSGFRRLRYFVNDKNSDKRKMGGGLDSSLAPCANPTSATSYTKDTNMIRRSSRVPSPRPDSLSVQSWPADVGPRSGRSQSSGISSSGYLNIIAGKNQFS